MSEEPLNLNPETYPNFGKAENVDFFKNIWDAPVEEKAKYADAICKRYHNNKEFLDNNGLTELLNAIHTTPNESSVTIPLNNTALGNIAYLSLNAPEPYATTAKMLLEAIRANTKAHSAYQDRYMSDNFKYIIILLDAIFLYIIANYIFTTLLGK
jgi:hypothetical protein